MADGETTIRTNPSGSVPHLNLAVAEGPGRQGELSGGRRVDPAHSARPVEPGGMYLPGVDVLRGLALITVITHQAIDSFGWKAFPSGNPLATLFRIGWVGMDLLVVIGAFLATLGALTLLDRRPSGFARAFLLRRFARIAPAHYTAWFAFVALLVPSMLGQPRFWLDACAHLLFVHNLKSRSIVSISSNRETVQDEFGWIGETERRGGSAARIASIGSPAS
jgi:peptidoglycan/LPS O-acetylase OafA/YrhL